MRLFRGSLFFGERMRKACAVLLLAVTLSAGAFSAFVLAHEADHDCGGGDCPVCALLARCAENLQRLGSGVPPAPLLPAAAAIVFAAAWTVSVRRPVPSTPVSLKVRLNL